MEYKFTNAPVDLDALPDHQQLVYTPTLKARLYKALLVIGLFYIVLIRESQNNCKVGARCSIESFISEGDLTRR